MLEINVQSLDFDHAAEYEALRSLHRSSGAIVTFTGLVRELYDLELPETQISSLHLEHYPGMTEKSLEAIAEEAELRWQILGCRIIHRVGRLEPGDQIVFVGVAGAHRKEAFEAAEFIMDFLKSRAPFWKKQKDDSGESWVASKSSDEDALLRWQKG